MIIKLPNADFSANNIGTVDLRTEVSASTQALLDYYGKTWTLPQQFAIEDFLVKLNGYAFKSKIKKLVLPILAPIQASIAKNSSPKALYDIINEVIVPVTYGGAYTTSREITVNGLYDNRLTTNNANDVIFINLGTPTSWSSTHFGIYYHKTRNEQNTIILSDAGSGYTFFSDDAYIGSPNKATAVFDPNSYATRGLRLVSFDGTSVTGVSANLPFASTNVNAPVGLPSGTDFVPYLLNRYTLTDDVTLSLITFGDALTQAESDEYNQDISTLMDAIWTV
jgi:hypothetical protein